MRREVCSALSPSYLQAVGECPAKCEQLILGDNIVQGAKPSKRGRNVYPARLPLAPS